MSPSEADLRAALREGEGDGVDPDDIIWNVRHARARRRSMLLSAAAAVVLVAGTVAGVTALVHAASTPNGAAGAGQASVHGAGGSTATASPSTKLPACPEPHKAGLGMEPNAHIANRCGATSGSGTPARGAGTSVSLLPGTPKAFLVTEHPIGSPAPSGAAHTVTLNGAVATQLAASLRNLLAAPIAGCSAATTTPGIALDIIPIAPTGQHLPPITAHVAVQACETKVTSGNRAGYDWQVPASVKTLLHLPSSSSGPIQLTPPVHGESGSPPHS